MKWKNKKSRFLSMLFGRLSVALLGNMLAGKGAKTASQIWGDIGASDQPSRVRQDFYCHLILWLILRY